MREHPYPQRIAAALLLATLAAGCATPSNRLVCNRLTLQPVSLEELSGIGLAGFRSPARWDEVGGLYLLEPYRPGAIPVVLTHGLLSDPGTWKRMHRRLQCDPLIAGRFQFWAFAYPTGPSYLHAAADLREELSRVRSGLDSGGLDPALSQAVLVGHSMGGIVSRLQIAESGCVLWRVFAGDQAPMTSIDAQSRAEIERLVLFRPQPGITRAVFIATPHGGSDEARGRLAQLGRSLVVFPEQMLRGYEAMRTSPAGRLMQLPVRPPTSVEHLDPCHPILQAVRRLPTSPAVRTHTILGIGEETGGCDGDGYVSVCSAAIPGVDSQFHLPAEHTDVHREDAAINEVRRILMVHLANIDTAPAIGAASSNVRQTLKASPFSRDRMGALNLDRNDAGPIPNAVPSPDHS